MITHRTMIGVVLAWLAASGAGLAQTTSFSYQGKLTDGGAPASGAYDLQFALWDSATGGTQVGQTQTLSGVAVSNGVFTVGLDFGASSFPGADRFLEISARTAGGGAFTLLTPRQQVTSSPYAVRSASANALSGSCVGCITSSQIATVDAGKLTGTIPASALPSGGSFIQNATTAQPGNFNISGDGTVGGTLNANVISAATRYDIGSTTGLFLDAHSNASAAGAAHAFTTGSDNALFGPVAGLNLTSGAGNSVFGSDAALTLQSGFENSIFGFVAGSGNDVNFTGNGNSFFGAHTGKLNSTGSYNAYVGYEAGQTNTTGHDNSFLGHEAGTLNGGSFNTFVGSIAGQHNTTGGGNAFLGESSGLANTTGSFNTVLGDNANVGAPDLNHATAVGAGSTVLASNTIALGRTLGLDHVVVYGYGSGGNRQLCRNPTNEISLCSSSLRYKSNVAPFAAGLSLVDQLRPISYDWKSDGSHDVGFAAEEVARIDPRLVTFNESGEVEGVKYDRLSTVFVNAFREQQAEIERLRDQLRALTALACAGHPEAPVCQRDQR